MHCKNCNSALISNSNFCIVCGNKVITKRLTVKEVIRDFNNQFFDYDNKLFKTFIHLFTKPEVVIEKFIDGSRKTYVNVISYLAISLTLIGFQFFFIKNQLVVTQIDPIAPNTNQIIENQRKMVEILNNFYEYFGLITMLTIPIIAFATYIIFINFKYNYAEHIVLNMYIAANYTIIMIITSSILILFGLNAQISYAITTLPIYVYLGYCFKRLFKLSFFSTVWRTIVSQMLYTVFVAIFLVILVIITLIYFKMSGRL